MPEPQPLPTPINVAYLQVAEALEEMQRNYSLLPSFPWEGLTSLVGPPLPRDLWVVGARTGNGKTSLALNLFDHWVSTGTATLYIGAGSEGPPKDLRRQWAALRVGLPAHHVLANEWTALPQGSKERIEEELARQAKEEYEYAHFSACERLTPGELVEALKSARRTGCGYVILDHIHRLRFDAQTDLRRALSEATRFLRDWASKYDLVVVVMAQLHRAASSHGTLRDLIPPVDSDLKETGTLEEDSVVILLLHRVKRAEASAQQIAAVARGERPIEDILEPRTMAIRVGKHRRNGHVRDQTMFLRLLDTGRLETRSAVWKDAVAEREPGEDGDAPF